MNLTGKIIVALGDSIAWYGSMADGFVRLVQAGLLAAGMPATLYGAGVSSQNATQMFDRMTAEVLPYNADWLICMAGTNDAWGGAAQSVELYAAALQNIIDLAESRRCRVLLCTPPMIDAGIPPTYHNPAKMITGRPYPMACRAIAAANPDVVLADVWSAFLATKDVLTFDGTHPNPAGHALIAATILRAWGIEG